MEDLSNKRENTSLPFRQTHGEPVSSAACQNLEPKVHEMSLISVPGPNPLEALLNLLILLFSRRKDQQTFHTDSLFPLFRPCSWLGSPFIFSPNKNCFHALTYKNCLIYYIYISFLWWLSKLFFVTAGAQRTGCVSRSLWGWPVAYDFLSIDGFMGIRWGVMLEWSFGFYFRSHGSCFSFTVTQIYMEYSISFFQ